MSDGVCESPFYRGGIPADKLYVRHNCIADPGERTVPASKSHQLAYIGRLAGEKGVRGLLEAWRLARVEGVELLVVGDGPERAALEAMRVPGVQFTGPFGHPAVLETLRSVRCLLLPSLWFEGEPMIVIEALAAGTPVVGSDLGGIPELLGHGSAGWLAKAGDVGAWGSLWRISATIAGIDEKSRAARDMYLKLHTPCRACRALSAVTSRSCPERRQPQLSGACACCPGGDRPRAAAPCPHYRTGEAP